MLGGVQKTRPGSKAWLDTIEISVNFGNHYLGRNSERTFSAYIHRVFKAVSVGDMHKARSIQKLILKSRAARFLAIRQVTQLNAGKKTPGIDKKLALTHL